MRVTTLADFARRSLGRSRSLLYRESVAWLKRERFNAFVLLLLFLFALAFLSGCAVLWPSDDSPKLAFPTDDSPTLGDDNLAACPLLQRGTQALLPFSLGMVQPFVGTLRCAVRSDTGLELGVCHPERIIVKAAGPNAVVWYRREVVLNPLPRPEEILVLSVSFDEGSAKPLTARCRVQLQ